MPSDLIEPTGMAPARGDETLSPLRRSRNDSGERVARRREVGYDPTPEAAHEPERRPDVPVPAVPLAGREVA